MQKPVSSGARLFAAVFGVVLLSIAAALPSMISPLSIRNAIGVIALLLLGIDFLWSAVANRRPWIARLLPL